jgi:hypothetical protein
MTTGGRLHPPFLPQTRTFQLLCQLSDYLRQHGSAFDADGVQQAGA